MTLYDICIPKVIHHLFYSISLCCSFLFLILIHFCNYWQCTYLTSNNLNIFLRKCIYTEFFYYLDYLKHRLRYQLCVGNVRGCHSIAMIPEQMSEPLLASVSSSINRSTNTCSQNCRRTEWDSVRTGNSTGYGKPKVVIKCEPFPSAHWSLQRIQ